VGILGFRVWGLEVRVSVLGWGGVGDLGFRAEGVRCRVEDLGLRV